MSSTIDYTSQINTTTGISSSTTALAENNNRRSIVLQNLGTNPLFVKFGENASTTDFTFILKGGTSNDDGTGEIFVTNILSYTGIITVSGSNIRYVATDF